MPILIFNLLVGDFLGELIDFLLLSVKILLHLGFVVELGNIDLFLQVLNVSLELITLLLFDKDFLRWDDLVVEFLVLAMGILVADVEDAENTILTG